MDYNDVMCCIERDWGDMKGFERPDFTLAEAEELAHAWEVSFKHSTRLALLLKARIDVNNLRVHQEYIGGLEALAIENPTLYAERERIVHVGDCYEDCTAGCQGGTECYHGWCESCALRAVKERAKTNCGWPIIIKFGYSPVTVASYAEDGTRTELPTEEDDS